MSALGRCKACGTMCGGRDIPLERWTGFRLTVTLANGSHMDLTVCADCVKVAEEDEDGFLSELEDVVARLWVDESGTWLEQYFKHGTPFLAVSHVIPWSVAGKGK